MADGDNKVYVLDDGANKHEGMTKSEIMDTIVEMMETGQVTGGIYIDAVKEQNAGERLKFWVGTQAQYEALPEIDPYIDYKITDANTLQEIDAALTQLKEQLTSGAFKVKSAYTADDVKTSINGKAISEIFESDGKTAKKATIATADENGNNIMASYALKDDLQDAEGDIDALEGRMTTAEGDIDALEAEQRTNAKLTQVVRVDAAQSLTDEQKQQALENVGQNTSISTTSRVLATYAFTAGYSTYVKLGTFYIGDSNIDIDIIAGLGAANTSGKISMQFLNGNIARISGQWDQKSNNITFWYNLRDKEGNYGYIDIYYNNVPYGKMYCTVRATGATLIEKAINAGSLPATKVVIPDNSIRFATDPSKLAPSTANGWTETTNNGSLPGAGVYLVQVELSGEMDETMKQTSVGIMVYQEYSYFSSAPVLWVLGTMAALRYSSGSSTTKWSFATDTTGTSDMIEKIRYKRIA